MAAVNQQLDRLTIEWDARVALGVVLAAVGYPERYDKGEIIKGLPNESDAQKHAYELVKQISWPNMFYRNDIGYHAIKNDT